MEYLSYKFMPPKASKPTNKLVLRPNRTEYSPQPDETDSLYSEKDTSSILNVTTTPDPSCTGRTEKSFGASSTPNKTTSKSTDKCPCGKSDPQSTKVICAKCKRHWHNRCCNLSGLTQPMIKKLETWQCPKCYSCPILSQQPASLHAEFSAMKQQINLLLESNSQKECCQSISAEVTALREQLSELVKVSKENEVKVKLSPDLEEAVRQVAQLSPELIAKIEESVTELKGQVSGIETAISNHSKAPSEKAVAPNTQSPNISTKVISPCTPYVNYQPNVISDDDRDEVLKFIKANEEHFQSLGKDSGSRDVMYFGEYTYRYTGHTHDAREMPETLTKILNAAKTAVPEGSKSEFNSCLITRYKTGQNHIPQHRDDEPVIDPESSILTVSFGAQRSMSFENNDKSKSKELLLEDKSVLVTSRFAQDFWNHGILPNDGNDERVSLTFRNIAPYYINSTIILGDSNTSRINFGRGKGTLGAWVPGKRVKVGHIEAIPNALDIGPYRHIVIHTGVNSINTQKYRKSDTYLLHFLENKCKEILDVYPKTKVHLSLLLPSRSRQLNYHIDQFNRGILDLTYRYKNLLIVDNSLFGDVLSDEHGRWDFNRQQPYTADILHLGKKGIRVFALNLKNCIMGKSKSQSRSRFNASRGSYGFATGFQGYQPS